MKARCPNCQTVFRITPEQLKARAGKVRCGQCQTVFNALDSLLDEKASAPTPILAADPVIELTATPVFHEPDPVAEKPALVEVADESVQEPSLNPAALAIDTEEPGDAFYISSATQDAPATLEFEPLSAGAIPEPVPEATAEPAPASEERIAPRLTESAAQELGKATGLIMPRETTEIPGYSKWSEGVMAAPVSLPTEKPTRWPFVLVALLLVLTLAGQIIFRFRSELATTMPSLRPMLASASEALGSRLPLPHHVDLISIEVSDLQNDPAHGNLLVLNATLRNRAAYGQAYPSLELSLTDTQDAAIARRVFSPKDYLPAKIAADQPFAANSDLAVRVWIEAKDITAAGYRLYVFYP